MATLHDIEPNSVMMIDAIQGEEEGYYDGYEDEHDLVLLNTDEQGQRWITTVGFGAVGFGVPLRYEVMKRYFTEEQKSQLENEGYTWD